MSKRIVIELTNRCNLACSHCFTGRHGGSDDLSLEVIEGVLASAKGLGFEHLTFTGGDPTVHPRFPEIARMTSEAGYRWSFVTNGWNFTTIWPRIRALRAGLSVITFSLDGASEATHDRLRGRNSYRRVMRAVTLAMMEEVPFTFNMVVTGHNRHEVGEMVQVAADLGAQGVRFGHLMPAPITTAQGFDLTPEQRKTVEAEIHGLRRSARISVGMAPGYHTTDLFPCAPLNLQEMNIDCHGQLSTCCHLSSHGGDAGTDDVVGDLAVTSFAEAYGRLEQIQAEFRERKLAHLRSGQFRDSDYFPCWYCSLYYDKVGWLKQQPKHEWIPLMWKRDELPRGAAELAAAEAPAR